MAIRRRDRSRVMENPVMRSFGIPLAAVLVVALAVPAQPPATSALDGHLAGWENAMKDAKNFSMTFELTRTDPVFKKERKFTGSAMGMKPNLMRFNIASATDKNDYELY